MNSLQAFRPETSVTFFSERGEPEPYYEHCPLCVYSMVHPEQDSRPPAIIFLDMDGVMIADRHSPEFNKEIGATITNLFPHVQVRDANDYHWTVAKGRHLHPKALNNLHNLIERIEASGKRALVVLSSSWRNDATLQQHREEAFAEHFFCKFLCGKTAPEKGETGWTPECKQGFKFTKGAKEVFDITLRSRAAVIMYWLRDHGFDPNSTDFVVFDDDQYAGLHMFEERFISTYNLLLEKHIEAAARVLKV